jgi:hypothetical protein
MQPLEILYVAFSATLIMAGLTLVGQATKAYLQTARQDMLYLMMGFTFIVAAAIATTFSAFLTDFTNARLLLTVNYAITTVGYVLVVYSVVAE